MGINRSRLVANLLLFTVIGCSNEKTDLEHDAGKRDFSVRDWEVIGTDQGVADLDMDLGDVMKSPPLLPFLPDLEAQSWITLKEDLPNIAWETAVTYRPKNSQIFQHGGHGLGSYKQVPYTWMVGVRDGIVGQSKPLMKAPRRCLVQGVYSESLDKIIYMQGTVDHGTMPIGRIRDGGKTVRHNEIAGPFTYDPKVDDFQYMRVSNGPHWPKAFHHAPVYDSTSDVVFRLVGKYIYAYHPYLNRTDRFDAPRELEKRRWYGIGFDSAVRKLVIFGGTDGYAREKRFSDTWIYDLKNEKWTSIGPAGPTGGAAGKGFLSQPMVYHPPSGRLLMLDNALPTEGPVAVDEKTWKPTQLWSLDADKGKWEEIVTQNPPPFLGYLLYASNEDLLLLWGGGDDAFAYNRPPISRKLHAIRIAPKGLQKSPQPQVSFAKGKFYLKAGSYEVQSARVEGAYLKFDDTINVHLPKEGTWDEGPMNERRAFRFRDSPNGEWSFPVYNFPIIPDAPKVAVANQNEVIVRWTHPQKDLQFNIYRRKINASWKKLNSAPVPLKEFRDVNDISDGIAREYRITAMNSLGLESGFSPLGFTIPDKIRGFRVVEEEGGFRVKWNPTGDKDRMQIYYSDFHCNARGSDFDVFLDGFVEVGDPVQSDDFFLATPSADPIQRERLKDCPTHYDGHYFYARIINTLGQKGFFSDIISTTDDNMHP